jgi:hypothetical protein
MQAPVAKVAVWSPEGKKEIHTHPNARDLVNGAGYSWTPNGPSQPAAVAPFRPVAGRTSQDVLDSVGSDNALRPSAPVTGQAGFQEATAETEVEFDPEGDVTPEVVENDVADEAPARGRGRRARSSAED